MTDIHQRLLAVIALGLLVVACAKQPPPVDPFFEKWKTKAETAQPYIPAPKGPEILAVEGHGPSSAPADGTSLAAAIPATPIDLPKEPLTVRFIDDDLATALRTLARIAHQNIMISPSVQGKLNLQTQETAWDTVFMGIINSYGLTVVKEDNLLHVMSMEDLKQQVERKTLQLQKQQVSPLTTRIVPIEFSDPKTIAESVTLLLSKDKDGKARGSATVDQHSRSLILLETDENIEKLLSVVRQLDKPTSQVLIAAHIVETNKDTARELGIQWGAMSAHGVLGDSRVNLNPGSTAATFVPGTAAVAGTAGTAGGAAIPGLPGSPTIPATAGVAAIPGTPAQLVYPSAEATALGQNVALGASPIKGIIPASLGLIANGNDLLLSTQLSALQRDGKLNILSSPSIATLDNSQAFIESGRDVPIQTYNSSSANSGSQAATTIMIPATLKLIVTPHVISGRMVKLDIEASKNEVDTSSNVNGNPFIIRKNAKTQLIVENNATVVIAGLSKETHSASNSGVPGAKDVPGLGWLFKKDSRSQEFEELLIFITPKILTRSEDGTPSGEALP